MHLAICLIAAALPGIAAAQYSGVARPPEELKKGYDTISVSDAKRVLTYLSTQCDGRGTGQPGYEKAAQYVANQFKGLRLKPIGDNGTFFQSTDFTRWRFPQDTLKMRLVDRRVDVDGKDLILRGGPSVFDIQSHLVFLKPAAGAAGVTDPNDNFKGDLVIIEADRRSVGLENNILQEGADAVLTVVGKKAEASWHPHMGTVIPNVSKNISGTIAAEGVEKLRKALDSSQKTTNKNAAGFEITTYAGNAGNIQLNGRLAVETVKVGNVVAELPGSDPKLADEFVGVGGHLDHLGDQDGVVYPGADDDGSGSTSVIEIARAMVANPKKPRRSIVFMTFFGEEMGLLGSRFLTNNPPVPLDKMVAELQMDMVGRDSDGAQNGDQRRIDVGSENTDTIRLVGSKRISTELDKTIQELNTKYIGFKFKYDAEDVYTRSDHYNFAAKGIPIAFLFDGFHPDYHRPTDTIEKIDWLKLTSAARLYYLTAHAVADADAAPVKDVPQNG